MVGQPDIIDLNRSTGYSCRDVLRIPILLSYFQDVNHESILYHESILHESILG